jgi:hypothetical protein
MLFAGDEVLTLAPFVLTLLFLIALIAAIVYSALPRGDIGGRCMEE